MTHILHTTSTVHKTASLADDERNSAYCQSSGTHNIKRNLWKLASTLMPKGWIELGTFCSRERGLNHSATAPLIYFNEFTLKEETFARRNFCGSKKPRNIYISRE